MLNAWNKDGGCEEWASEVEGASPSGWLLGREAGALPLEPLERRRKLSPGLPPGEKKVVVGGSSVPPKMQRAMRRRVHLWWQQGCEKWGRCDGEAHALPRNSTRQEGT